MDTTSASDPGWTPVWAARWRLPSRAEVYARRQAVPRQRPEDPAPPDAEEPR